MTCFFDVGIEGCAGWRCVVEVGAAGVLEPCFGVSEVVHENRGNVRVGRRRRRLSSELVRSEGCLVRKKDKTGKVTRG